jgi:hypothetical protein
MTSPIRDEESQGTLPLMGGGDDVGTDPPHDRADLDVRGRDVLQERGGKRAVPADSVKRHIVGLGGVSDRGSDRAQAQVSGAAKLFFEGDMVRGGQPGAPGPVCVLDNQYKHLEKIVWRFRVLDQNGKALDGTGLKSLVVELPDGQKVNAQYGPHPGPANPTDFFWTAIWIIPSAYPNGTFVYKATATDAQGQTATWEPFKRVTSQLQVVPGEIEIKKP